VDSGQSAGAPTSAFVTCSLRTIATMGDDPRAAPKLECWARITCVGVAYALDPRDSTALTVMLGPDSTADGGPSAQLDESLGAAFAAFPALTFPRWAWCPARRVSAEMWRNQTKRYASPRSVTGATRAARDSASTRIACGVVEANRKARGLADSQAPLQWQTTVE